MQKVSNKKTIEEQYIQYLTDESRLVGDSINTLYFPESTDDVAAVVREVAERGESLTISGGRTGIVGGAVPQGSLNLISLEKLGSKIFIGYDGEWFARVAAGTLIEDLYTYLRNGVYAYLPGVFQAHDEQKLFYPVNPTETTAQVGGTVASNASGSRSFFYGATRAWVRRLTVVLADGTILNLVRGERKAVQGIVDLREDLRIPVSDIAIPETKQTVGYYLHRAVDPIDLFIGSEGTLGIITEVDLKLIPAPPHTLGQILYFKDRKKLLQVVTHICEDATLAPIALEYFDEYSLTLLRQKRSEEESTSSIVVMPAAARAALYIENIFADDAALEVLYRAYEELFETVGCSAEDSWAGFDEKTLEQMYTFRHAVPEIINSIIGQRKGVIQEIHKISSDMAVPRKYLKHILTFYEKKLKTSMLEYVVFGHIGDGNVHVNILPRTMDEIKKGEQLFQEFAHEVLRCQGSVAAEHGIGRVKKALLLQQYPPDVIQAMCAVKKSLDKQLLLNPGVLFDIT